MQEYQQSPPRFKSCGCDTVYHIAADLRIPRRIKLKPSFVIADGPNGFCAHRRRWTGIGNIRVCRFACQNTFCIRPDRAGQAHWCNERNVKLVPEKFERVEGFISKNVRHHSDSLKRPDIPVQPRRPLHYPNIHTKCGMRRRAEGLIYFRDG